jgi:hypothetical protein
MKWYYGIVATAFMLSATCSNAQHGHEDGHLDYENWSSKKTANCCNNEDCGYLASDEWRQNIQGDEVKIQNQWCPVKPEHYITKGKSPDWTKAHACIAKGGSYANVCDRLLCFAGMPNY